MQAINSNTGERNSNSKYARPRQNPAPKGDIKTRSTTKKSVIGVSNISVSIRSSKKATDSSTAKGVSSSSNPLPTHSEIGIQVDEVEILAVDYTRIDENAVDAPIIRLPSAKVIREIEKIRQRKKDLQLKERIKETRKFEEHSAKEEIHLNNLKEFLDTGAITRKRDGNLENRNSESDKAAAEKTKNAVNAIDRIKQREEDLIKLFNSI